MLRISSMMLVLSFSMECALSRIFGEPWAASRDKRGIDLDRRQTLTELIVQLAGEPFALVFLRLDHAPSQVATLRCRHFHRGRTLIEAQRDIIHILQLEARQPRFQVSGLQVRQRCLHLDYRLQSAPHHPVNGRAQREQRQCHQGQILTDPLFDLGELRHRVGGHAQFAERHSMIGHGIHESRGRPGRQQCPGNKADLRLRRGTGSEQSSRIIDERHAYVAQVYGPADLVSGGEPGLGTALCVRHGMLHIE
jgi:hypothetical protein